LGSSSLPVILLIKFPLSILSVMDLVIINLLNDLQGK
jgi:hypothetical protein